MLIFIVIIEATMTPEAEILTCRPDVIYRKWVCGDEFCTPVRGLPRLPGNQGLRQKRAKAAISLALSGYLKA